MFHKLCGRREDRVAIQQAAGQFGSLSQVASNLMGGEQKNVYLWRPLLQVKPSWRRGAQAIGDCFVEGTKVTLEDENSVSIETINDGDTVVSGKGIPRKVIRTIHKPSQTHNMVEVSTGDGHSLQLTCDHQLEAEIGSDRYSWVAAGMLKLGQKLRHWAKGQLIEKPVISLREYRAERAVFCLEVEEDHSFIAEGVVSKNCTSWGVELAATTLMATQDRLGGGRFVAEAATESLYGGARVECAGGRPGGSRPGGSQDGSVPAWCALFVKEYGVTLRLDYSRETGNPEHDLRIYSGKKAKSWGNYGCGGGKDGGKLDNISKEHPVGHIAQVRTIAEGIASLTNGYAFTIGSSAGFGQMRRDENGICRWVDSWGHQMLIWALRWRLGKPEFRCCQSWGDVVSGPDPGILDTIKDIWRPDTRAIAMAYAGRPMFVKPNLPWENFPALADMRAEAWNPISATSWWITEQDMARIMSSGDCWTYSDIQGFKKRDLDIVKAAGTWVTG